MNVTHQQDVVKSESPAATIMALDIDGYTFFLPQSDLVSFENMDQLDLTNDHHKAIASYQLSNQIAPVYCLSKDLELLNNVPEERKICVISGYMEKRFGILCDKIQKLSYSEIKFEEIPPCMAVENTPISEFFLYRTEEGVVKTGFMLRSRAIERFLSL